ncbi:DNA adenine methylase [Vibrio aestuarianus]|uniref:DNA adenine methylase n=1 Tax=Vibrio aestuarianus TaxID=28171 RepID=UPI00159455C5|nr:DNA adenine methylase [Vibrio aestuarianus]NGZ18009.1 DNA adenine methylase [Vibrio aestuarianus]
MSYLGSKGASGAYQLIIGLMPPHNTYIESHLGSGVVMKKKPRSARSIGLDLCSKALSDFEHDGVETYQVDANQYLNQFDYKSNGETLVYCDPPYLPETRTSKERYNFEYTRADHIKLLKTIRDLPAKVIISGYPSKLYDEMLSDWNKKEFQVMSRGGVRTECVWFNFEPSSKHWATYAGKDFTDRQRISRKAERWAKKYQALSENERLAIMAALLESHSQ